MKIVISVTLIFLFSLSETAHAWINEYADDAYKQGLEIAQKEIDGIILSALKQEAIEGITEAVGEAAGEKVISDPEEFIFTNAEEDAYLATTDMLTYMTGGRTTDYVPAEGNEFLTNSDYTGPRVAGASTAREGVVKGISSWSNSGNYTSYLIRQGKNSINRSVPQTDILNYVSDPSRMFATGNWRAFSSFISNQANNPFGVSLMAQNNYSANVSRYTELNKSVYETGEGYAPKISGGKITTPGSIIRDLQADANNTTNDFITNATYKSEVVIGLVNRVISNAMK